MSNAQRKKLRSAILNIAADHIIDDMGEPLKDLEDAAGVIVCDWKEVDALAREIADEIRRLALTATES